MDFSFPSQTFAEQDLCRPELALVISKTTGIVPDSPIWAGGKCSSLWLANMKELLKLFAGITLAVGTGIWAYPKALAFLEEHGGGTCEVATKPRKVEIQTLFHGNT